MNDAPENVTEPYPDSADVAGAASAPLEESNRRMPRLLYFGLQPLLLIAVVAFFLRDPQNPFGFLVVLVTLQLALFALERLWPGRKHWLQPAPEKLRNLAIVCVGLACSIFVGTLYAIYLSEPLSVIRANLALDVWPGQWPLPIQILLSAMLSELLWYWLHRGEHRYALMWRLTAHGAHHSFKRLEAINFGTNHPFEYVVLVLPGFLMEVLFGAGLAAAGGTLLVATQASIVHSNLALNSKGIDWLFTTNKNHIRHHSAILEQSNTNYGCAIICWDRLFGTYAYGDTLEAGIGPQEPTLLEKLLMPWREPATSEIAPRLRSSTDSPH